MKRNNIRPGRLTNHCTGCGRKPVKPALVWDDGSVFCQTCLNRAREGVEIARRGKKRRGRN